MRGPLNNWTGAFRTTEFPPLPCPSCAVGTLALASKSLKVVETAESRFYWEKCGDPENYQGRFMCRMVCANSRCRETVHVTGQVGAAQDYDTPGNMPHYVKMCRLDFAMPAPPLIHLPDNCPQGVREELERSFQVFLPDPSAAANRVRKCVEQLMTAQKIARFKNVRGKRVRLVLHDRIQKFAKRSQRVAELLLAVKWIGNEGSHEELTHEDVYSGLELAEEALEMIYDPRLQRLSRRAKEINRRKGIARREKGKRK